MLCNPFPCNQIRRLDVGQLQMYGSVTWLNALEQLGRVRKDTQLVTILFVFKVGIVILSVEKQKMRKKRHKVRLNNTIQFSQTRHTLIGLCYFAINNG